MKITFQQYLVMVDALQGSLKVYDSLGLWNWDEETRRKILKEIVNLRQEVEVTT